MSVVEIAQHLGLQRSRVDASITGARKHHPGKFFRVVRYQMQTGIQGRDARIYAAGPGPDASRPSFDEAHVTARSHSYYLRNRARFAINRKRRSGVVAASHWEGLVPMARRST